jgi:hypothetical protein
VFDGPLTRGVTARKQIFYRGRIFATIAGVFLRKHDTISPAKSALVPQRIPQDWAGCVAAISLPGID